MLIIYQKLTYISTYTFIFNTSKYKQFHLKFKQQQYFEMSYNKKFQTGFEKRTLAYSPSGKQNILQLPQKYYSKISNAEYKKIKQVFYIMSGSDYTLTYQNFTKAIRSLGIIVKTGTLYQLFGPKKDAKMAWDRFIQSYLTVRNNKGSFKQVDVAINLLDKQYNGRWEILFQDLKELGDVLTERELRIFKQEIMAGQVINNQNLKNALLGYK